MHGRGAVVKSRITGVNTKGLTLPEDPPVVKNYAKELREESRALWDAVLEHPEAMLILDRAREIRAERKKKEN